MAFLDKIGQLAKTAADKTTEVVEVNRLNLKLNAERNNLQGLKSKIGDFYWAKFQAGEPWDPALNEVCAEIQASLSKIEALKTDIADIKDKDPNTGGMDTMSVSSGTEATVALCPICGIQNALNAKFCRECGAKL